MEKAEEDVLRMEGVIKTGNASCGYQGAMYDTKINTYDPVDLDKLAMEVDIPWNEEPMDTYRLYQTSLAKKSEDKL